MNENREARRAAKKRARYEKNAENMKRSVSYVDIVMNKERVPCTQDKNFIARKSYRRTRRR